MSVEVNFRLYNREVYVSANRTFLTLENAQNCVLNAHIEGVTKAQTVICESA